MKRSYRLSLPGWAVPQREEYFEKMAERGLFVKKCGFYLTRFEKGEPCSVCYRLDAAPGRNQPPEEEKRRFYASCGWEYVCDAGYFNLYRASRAGELHTDPQWQQETLVPVRKSLRSQLVWNVVYALLWLGYAWLSHLSVQAFHGGLTFGENLSLLLAQIGFLTPALLGLMLAALLLDSGLAAAEFSGYIKALTGGKTRAKGSLQGFMARHYGLFAARVATTLAVIAALLLTIPQGAPTDQAPGAQHLLRLEQLEPGVTVLQGESNLGGKSDWVEYIDRPFSSLWLDSTQLSDENANIPWIYQRYLELKGPLDPATVAGALCKYYSLGVPQPVEQSRLPAGVDLALLDDSREHLLEGCAVFGNRVLYVQYFSHDAGADQLLEAMAQALCAP